MKSSLTIAPTALVPMHALYRCLFVLVCAASCKAPPLPESTGPSSTEAFLESYDASRATLAAGDRLGVVVLGQPEFSSPRDGIPLDSAGRLRLPLVGAVELAGSSLDEAEEILERDLAEFVQRPDVTLQLLAASGQRFFAFGALRQPGPYPLTPGLTAYQALSLAGGVVDGGDREQVCLLRERNGLLDVHLFDARTPDASGFVPLHPDDLLFVRLTGSGRFREQVLPIVQGLSPALSSLVNFGLVAEALK